MKIATWNVNSVRARLPLIINWLKDFSPDVVLLQETKTQNDTFPYEDIEDLGYNIIVHGQKSYNGVAILSKFPIEDVLNKLPGDEEDDQARYIECFTNNIRVASVYVPNGRELESDHFEYKISFLKRLKLHMKKLMHLEEKLVLGGDFNITQTIYDLNNGDKKIGRLHCSIPERLALRELTNIGLVDVVREIHPIGSKSGTDLYSWWDYRKNSWEQNNGMLIDMIYASPQSADCLKNAGIDKTPRALQKASDHTPVWCELEE